MAFIGFDATQVAPSTPNTPIPAGKYLAHIVESDVNPTKAGNGLRAKFVFQIIEGAYEKRRVWKYINIQHTNPQAQQIGQSEMSGMCHAIGNLKPNNTEELHFKPVRINVTIRPAKDGYEESNDIKSFESAIGASFSAPAAPTSGAVPSAPAANVPAWAKKA